MSELNEMEVSLFEYCLTTWELFYGRIFGHVWGPRVDLKCTKTGSRGCSQGGPPGHWSDLAFVWAKPRICGAFLGPGAPQGESVLQPGDLANSVALEPGQDLVHAMAFTGGWKPTRIRV